MTLRLAQIVRQELLRVRRETTSWILILMLAAASLYAVLSGAITVRGYMGMVEGSAQRQAARVANLLRQVESGHEFGLYDPADPGAVGFTLAPQWVALPPGPFAGLATGLADVLPVFHRTSLATRQALSAADDEEENPDRLALGRFDLAFVIVYLFPLVLLALTYNVVSEERESGTLPLLLTQSITLGELLAGKMIVRGGAAIVVVVAISVLGAALASVQLRAGHFTPMLLVWVGVTIIYAGFWLSLAAAVNVYGRHSSTNATILISAWLLLTIVVPTTLNVLAEQLHPVPSRILLTNAIRDATATAEARGADLLSSFYGDHPELVARASVPDMQSYFATKLAVREAVREESRPIREAFEAQLARQRSLADRYRFASAALLMDDALTSLAGTDIRRHIEYLRQVGVFEDTWEEFFAPRIVSRSGMTAQTYDSLPHFVFDEPSLGIAAARAGSNALGMLLPIVFLAAATVLRLRHYSPG